MKIIPYNGSPKTSSNEWVSPRSTSFLASSKPSRNPGVKSNSSVSRIPSISTFDITFTSIFGFFWRGYSSLCAEGTTARMDGMTVGMGFYSDLCAEGTTQSSMGRSPMISEFPLLFALKGQHKNQRLCCPFRTMWFFFFKILGLCPRLDCIAPSAQVVSIKNLSFEPSLSGFYKISKEPSFSPFHQTEHKHLYIYLKNLQPLKQRKVII